MRHTYGKLEKILDEVTRVRDLARTSLAPIMLSLSPVEWNEYRIEKIAYELTELIYDLENNINEKQE